MRRPPYLHAACDDAEHPSWSAPRDRHHGGADERDPAVPDRLRAGAGGVAESLSAPVRRAALCRRRLSDLAGRQGLARAGGRSEEHTSELPSLMRTSYAVFCLKKKI